MKYHNGWKRFYFKVPGDERTIKSTKLSDCSGLLDVGKKEATSQRAFIIDTWGAVQKLHSKSQVAEHVKMFGLPGHGTRLQLEARFLDYILENLQWLQSGSGKAELSGCLVVKHRKIGLILALLMLIGVCAN